MTSAFRLIDMIILHIHIKHVPASINRSCVFPSSVLYIQTHACSIWSKRDGCCNLWGGMTTSSKNPNVTVTK